MDNSQDALPTREMMTAADVADALLNWADWFDLKELEWPKKAAMPSFVLRRAAELITEYAPEAVCYPVEKRDG